MHQGCVLAVCHAYGDFICVGTQEIYQDRKKFSEQVFKVASSDLVNMGIGVVSYTLKDVHDDQVLTDLSCDLLLAALITWLRSCSIYCAADTGDLVGGFRGRRSN